MNQKQEEVKIDPRDSERPWICFHCGFETTSHEEAKSHFGDRDDESPSCVFWRDLDADGKLSQLQSYLQELEREREENANYRTQVEGLEYRLSAFENLLSSRFPKCSTLDQAFNLYDSMEGRALAAEERCAKYEAETERYSGMKSRMMPTGGAK